MVVLLGILLAASCIAILALPFMRARRAGYVSPADIEAVQQVAARREAAFEELRLLRLDRDLGNVEEADYQRRFQELRVQAATLLREQDTLTERLRGVSDDVERQVAALRAQRRGTSEGTKDAEGKGS